MFKKTLSFLTAVILTISIVPALYADSGEQEVFSLHLIPGMSIPLGADADVFTMGGAGSLMARFSLPDFQYLSLELGAGYSITPVNLPSGSTYSSILLNIISGKLGIGFRVPIAGFLVVGVHAYGGYYYGFLSDQSLPNSTGNNPLLDAGVEVKFKLSPYFSFGVDASYRMFFGLSTDLLLGIGVSYHFPLIKGLSISGSQYKQNPQIDLSEPALDPVFPVFYTWYSDHRLGSVVIANKGKIPLENVKVTIFVNQYMDNATVCREIPFITGGAKQSIDLLALFNDRILNITEDTSVQVNIKVESTMAGEKYSDERIARLHVLNRNAMNWSDDRHAAAFVTMKDTAVLKFSKNVMSDIKDTSIKSLPKNLLTALAFFEALRKYGLSYAADPTTPFTEYFKNKAAVDYLQFPRHTLEYKAGDCDDLSILYCALLESVGIKTAFITVPGHIYAAVALDLTPAEAQKQLASAGDLIVKDNKVWLPVEITALSGGFLAAWQSGIKLWKEQEPRGQANLIVVQDAWKEFDPAYLPGEGFSPTLPSADVIQAAYLAEVMKLVERDLYPQAKKIEDQIKADPANPALANRLGVLYARYGVYDKAEAAFNRVPGRDSYAPVLVNLGNIAYLKNDPAAAKKFYDKAFAKNPRDPSVLLNLAKLSYEQGQYDKTDSYYAMLKKQDASMAGKYAYLAMKGEGGTARAAQSDAMKDQVAWGE
jgi:tetratricopeptide (TPR) repeat protein